MTKLGASADADRAGGLKPRACLRSLGLAALIPCAAACSQQSWPKDGDVYHRQIIMPDEARGRGMFYADKTGKVLPEVCDTFGSGETVCSEASFDKAPPVKQVRAELAVREKEWAKEKIAREAQEAEIKRMAKLGKRPVYSWSSDGKQSVKFLTEREINARFAPNGGK